VIPEDEDLAYLKIFRDIRQILYDEKGQFFWVINTANQLFKFDLELDAENLYQYDLFLREIRSDDGENFALQALQLSEDQNSISFVFSHPDFLEREAIEYQYRLTSQNNKNDDWSAWSPDNEVNFSFLPPGKYTLYVRSRNALGEIEEAAPINFSIALPYWQRPWFYALQIFILVMLLSLSYRLNRAKSRNRAISRVLMYLTLILIFSYIETVAESYFDFGASPVYQFGVQVGLAILILPIEELMIRLFTRVSNRESVEKEALVSEPTKT
jgi:hypothetical protein